MIAGSARVSALQKPARGGPLTCPFSKPRADAGLVTHEPHLEGSEERVRGAQGQVGHGARAHPVQETRGRESALHGSRLGLTTTVNGEEKKKRMNGARRRCRRDAKDAADRRPLGTQGPPTAPYPCLHWWLHLPLSLLCLLLVRVRLVAPPIFPSSALSAPFSVKTVDRSPATQHLAPPTSSHCATEAQGSLIGRGGPHDCALIGR